MKFINRQKELSRLNRLLKSEESELAVIWGRRRMGKTRLLLEWAHKPKGVYYAADESTSNLQRRYFSLAIAHALPGFADVEYPEWTALLTRLAKDAIQANWRGPLIIDELPYLIANAPELPSILQKFIDHDAKKARLIIALSGSSQRMMQGAILDASAPLFGRAKEIIKLGPINVGYVKEALNLTNPREIIETYAIFGGIPRYWELIKNNAKSLIENIDDLVLDPVGILNDEPNRLLLEESSMILRPILDAIGLGSHRLSEIATRIGKPTTSFSRMMQNLIELDLIEKEIPFKADEHNSKRTLYKIKDPFMRFWFKIVASQRSFFSQANSVTRKQYLKNHLQPLFSIAWEDLCRSSIANFTIKDYFFGGASRYWHKSDSEWDILSESIDKKALIIGEAKWVSKIPTVKWVYQTIEELKAKGLPPESKHLKQEIFYVLFIPEKPKNLNITSNVKVIDASEIIKLFD